MAATRNVVVIGSGPAGLTAALYSARANLKPLVIEGLEAGGQLMLTTMVENYPGYRDGIMGPDLMSEMRDQAQRFGAEFVHGNVEKVELCGAYPFRVKTSEADHAAKTIIVATGASARLLGLPSERTLMGHGVSTCRSPAYSSRLAIRRIHRSSAGRSSSIRTATSARTTARRRASPGCLRAATCRTTSIGRRSRQPVQGVWRRSTRSTSSTTSPNISRPSRSDWSIHPPPITLSPS